MYAVIHFKASVPIWNIMNNFNMYHSDLKLFALKDINSGL